MRTNRPVALAWFVSRRKSTFALCARPLPGRCGPLQDSTQASLLAPVCLTVCLPLRVCSLSSDAHSSVRTRRVRCCNSTRNVLAAAQSSRGFAFAKVASSSFAAARKRTRAGQNCVRDKQTDGATTTTTPTTARSNRGELSSKRSHSLVSEREEKRRSEIRFWLVN